MSSIRFQPFRGQSMFQGSIPALVTPMRTDGSLDFDAWDRVLDYHLDAGTDGVVVGGTTGESPVLDRPELEELIRRAKQRLRAKIPVIAGSGTNGTAKSIVLSQAAERAGADALLLVTPYYNKPMQDGLFQHFTAIADAVSLPVLLYNVPGRTGCDMLPETISRLSQHPRIVGVKEATGDVSRTAKILDRSRAGFTVLSGDDLTALDLMRTGARGVISVTANVAARQMREMCAAALASRTEAAAAIDLRLQALHKALFVESNPIPVKWAAHRLGLIGTGIRLPLTWLGAERQVAVEDALREAGVVAG